MKKKVDKAINLRNGLFFAVGIFFLLIILISRVPAKAQGSFNPDYFGNVYVGNVHGFAWSDTIGRTSFNCNNDFDGNGITEESESQCQKSSYGVRIDATTLLITGFAWSDNVGWVCFGSTCAPYSPGLPPGAPLGEGIEAKAWLDADGLAHGWAKIISLNSPGGWLSLKGTTDGDAFISGVDWQTGRWIGYAWQREGGGPGLGWFNFEGVVTLVLPPCQNGQTMVCGSSIGACIPGQRSCLAGQWGPCQGEIVVPTTEICDGKDNNCNGVVDENCAGGGGGGGCFETAEPEICDGKDNDCDGSIDEVASCQFQITMPKGIYEPLCCSGGASPNNGQCPTPSKAVFCDGENIDKPLIGQRLHQMTIKAQGIQALDGTDFSCLIKDGLNLEKSFSGKVDAQGGVILQITPGTVGAKGLSLDNSPWILESCVVSGKTPQAVNQPIYVHQNTWTDREENGVVSDLAHALACYKGDINVYFQNKKRCDFEGDVAFVRSMSRGVPMELNCQDKIDNDNNGLIDCADRACQGIAYNCL